MSQEEAKILGDGEDEQALKDGLENLIANLGTGKDKRANSTFVNNKRLSTEGNEVELDALYRTDWLAGKVVDIIPNDMTREWRTFDSDDLSPEDKQKLEDEEERLNLSHSYAQAHKWARLYGTAFIVLAVDDGKDPKEPLEIDSIKEGDLKHIKVIDRHRVSRGTTIESNPLKAEFGMPTEYRLNETSVVIHASRMLRFDGVSLPYEEFRRNNYWSDSVLDRLYDSITNFNTATNSSTSMIYETNVDIMRVKGLMSYLQSPEGEELLRKRFALVGQMKSFNNMVLLDQEEEHTSKNNTFAGLPDLIDRFTQILSAATDIPATRLLGSSANGLNATGEGDLKNYYDMIRSLQKNTYRPSLNYFDSIMSRNIGVDPDNMDYEFDSLFQMTDGEQADIDLKNSQRDQVYLDNGIIKPSAVAKDLKDKDTYTNITDEDIKELEEEEENANFSNAFTTPVSGEEQSENEEVKGSENSEKGRGQVPESSSKPNETATE